MVSVCSGRRRLIKCLTEHMQIKQDHVVPSQSIKTSSGIICQQHPSQHDNSLLKSKKMIIMCDPSVLVHLEVTQDNCRGNNTHDLQAGVRV